MKKVIACMDDNYFLFQVQCLKGRVIISLCVKALAPYKDFHKDFSEKIFVKNHCPYIKLLKKSLQL